MKKSEIIKGIKKLCKEPIPCDGNSWKWELELVPNTYRVRPP